MRICFVAEAPFIHTHKWTEYFVNRGHDVHILSLRDDRIEGATVHPIKHGLGKLAYLFALPKVKQLIQSIKPDILHAHHVTSYGLLAAVSGFQPLFVTCHGSDVLVSPKRSLLLKEVVKYVLTKAVRVTSVAQHMTKELIRMGIEQAKILTFQYGIDLSKFRKRDVALAPDVPIVLSTRQLKPIYNYELLLESVPYVLNEIPETRFVIVGDGPESSNLQQLSKNLGVAQNVDFVGRVTHERIIDYLNTATVFVSTSLSDGTSLCLLEAMACKLFPVVTDIPANQEWIEDGENGFLAPVDNPNILAGKLIEAIRNDELRKQAGEYNSSLVAKKADFQQNMRLMEEEYLSYLKKE